MNNPEEITECIAQAIQQRTASEILATMGTKILTQQNFQQFIRKYNKNISNRTIDEYYDKVVTENKSKYGITLEIFLKLIDSIPQPIQRTNIVINLVERIKQKKVSLDRIFEFFDKNKSGYLKGDDLREMFEYIYPKITEQEYKTVLKNNQQIQFSLEQLKTLLQYEQNANAEIVIVKSNIESPENSDQDEESNESDESDEEEEFSEDLYPESSPHYQDYIKFRECYNIVKESKQKFVDEQFPPNQKSLGSVGNSKYEWKRLSEVWKNADIFKADLYHNKSEPGLYTLVSPRDIKQGTLGDCYFLSSLASIAKKHPQIIADLFQTQEINQYGIYGIWLNLFGQWQMIILDDFVPFDKDRPAFSGSDHQEMWVILLEKAWAKVFGSYGNIVSGDPREVIASITGGPTWCISTDDQHFSEKLKPLMFSNNIVCAGTHSEHKDYNKFGLIPNHAYSVLNFKTIKLPDRTEVQLIKLKNPFGNDMEWKGDWSDYSPLWTQELKDNVLKHQENDGIFFMSLTDFQKYFDSIFVGFCQPCYSDCQILVNCQKRKASYILITIKKDIEIYFSAYQMSRKYFQYTQNNNKQEYEFSNIRMILCKMQKNNTITYVTSDQQADMSFHIGGRLQKGQYILQIKADWVMEGWEASDVALVGYGEEEVEMKFCQKIPKFQQTLILQEIKEAREILVQKNEKIPTNPIDVKHPNLVYQKGKSKAFSGVSYLYYQNLTKDKSYNFKLNIKGQVKIKKPIANDQIDIELKPGQDKIVCYKYQGKGNKPASFLYENFIINEV